METIAISFAQGVVLTADGDAGALRHLSAEYAPALTSGPLVDPCLELAFVRGVHRDGVTFVGRHKTVGWTVHVEDPIATPIRASIATHGRPRSFVLSLVQGYLIEALLSLAAAERGTMLVPAAAITSSDGATIVMGRSGAGKSTLCANALAAGYPILGDDQVFLKANTQVLGFPRRLRFYPDVERTAPGAYRRLSAVDRSRLAIWRAAAAGSKGFIRPPIRVPVGAIGTYDAGPRALRSFSIVERSADVSELQIVDVTTTSAIDLVMRVVDEQRERIVASGDPDWLARIQSARIREIELLESALQSVPISRYVVPRSWPAVEASARLAVELGIRQAGSRGLPRP